VLESKAPRENLSRPSAAVPLINHRRVTAFGRRFGLCAAICPVLGAQVIATTSTAEKAERLKALGASEVINYAETPDWDAKARELTDGRGVDCVVEIADRERSRNR